MKFFVRVENEIEKLAVLVKFEAWGVKWESGVKATQLTDFLGLSSIWYNFRNNKGLTYGTPDKSIEKDIPEANIINFLKAEKIEDVLPRKPFEVKGDCEYHEEKDIKLFEHSDYCKRNKNYIGMFYKYLNCHNCPDYEKKKKVVRYYALACPTTNKKTSFISYAPEKEKGVYGDNLLTNMTYELKVCPSTHRIYIDCEVDDE
jgi:hypothetical protein